jgi:hypothetical protein
LARRRQGMHSGEGAGLLRRAKGGGLRMALIK